MSEPAVVSPGDEPPTAGETTVALPDTAPAGPVLAASVARTGSDFRLRAIPILVVLLMGYGLPLASNLLIDVASDHVRVPQIHGSALAYNFLQHGVLLLLALIVIAFVKGAVRGDYGLHRPQGRAYTAPAVYWGLTLGLLTAAIEFGPQMLAHVPPNFDEPFTPGNIGGWLVYQGLYVGPTEEVLYRGLLVGYLTATMPGRIRIGDLEMNGAGIVVAIVLTLSDGLSFITRPFIVALAQTLCDLTAGILYALWLEKSKSLFAPIVSHNVAGLTRTVLMFALIAGTR